MNSALSFAPLTPKDAAEVMKKCVRTLDNWCRDGEMPRPATLGGSRYWHPDVFYGWLDAKLKEQDWDGELLAQAAPGAITPFQPVTREAAAKILKKTVRALEDWYGKDVMPRPAVIGGTCYWHPAIFFSWLDAKLKGRAWPSTSSRPEDAETKAREAQDPKERAGDGHVEPSEATQGRRPKRSKKSDGATSSVRGRARDLAVLAALNSPS